MKKDKVTANESKTYHEKNYIWGEITITLKVKYMGLFDKLRGEFIDIIEFLDNTQDTIVYRF